MTQIPTWSGGPTTPANRRAAPGTTIGGRYALRAAVGHGGMGTVWRASDTLLRRDVAVKEVILPPGLAPSDRDAMYERTLREARAAAALQHPAVVQVYDVVTEAGRPWIVMELLDARSLADMVIEDGPVAPRVVAKIGIALLGALEVAHAAGVLHRDVKPANVLICSDGRCVLTDFGVARMPTDVQLTTPGMVLGSPHFISPERAMGQDFGPPSDLFSLGVTLYTAVEGRPPFDKGDPIETMHAVVEDPPAPPSRAGVLADVLLGLLEKDPDQRFDVTTARSMLRTLLAGPLASKAPAHLMTDPYAVVPSQRSTPPAVPAARPTGEIGGRAMIKPGETLTDRLATQRGPAGRSTSGDRQAAAPLDQTSPDALGTSTGAYAEPMAATDQQPTVGPPPIGPPPGAGGTRAAQGWIQPGVRPMGSPPAGRVVAARGTPVSRAIAGVRRGGTKGLASVRAWPRKVWIAVGASLAVVLLLGTFALVNRPEPTTRTPAQAAPPTTAPAAPAFPTQPFTGRGVSVNVPEGWHEKPGGLYVDFIDPADASRRVRIIVEQFRRDAPPARWVEVAENGLKNRRTSCADPYARVDKQELNYQGRPAAQLEYTCGSGEDMRHGIWRVVPDGGKAYSFYLSTTAARFDESKPIFDEMARSFQLTAAG